MGRYSMQREREKARLRHEEEATRARGTPSSGRAREAEILGIKVLPLVLALAVGYMIWRGTR